MKKVIKILFLSVFALLIGSKISFAYDAIALPSNIETADPAVFINSLYNWGIGIVGFLAFAQFVISGIIYMTSGVVDKKKAATGRMTDALIGLGIALGAYLFLNIVNPTLLTLEAPTLETPTIKGYAPMLPTVSVDKKETFDPNQKNSLEQQGYTCTQEETGNIQTPYKYVCTLLPGEFKAVIEGGKHTATSASGLRQTLLEQGININKNECAPGQPEDCTNLAGVRYTTIDGVKIIKTGCDQIGMPSGKTCTILITGGAEPGHTETGTYTHSAGYKLDLRIPTTDGSNNIASLDKDHPLNKYIFGKIGNNIPEADKNYCGSDGNTYRLEIDHWDVVVGQKVNCINP